MLETNAILYVKYMSVKKMTDRKIPPYVKRENGKQTEIILENEDCQGV